jgi:hypothetical protein
MTSAEITSYAEPVGANCSGMTHGLCFAHLQGVEICISCGDCDEAFDLFSLCCVYVWHFKRAADYLAAVAGTYASADMAREGA